ncbi:MAG: polysaccharide deacetylase family protein [Propionibacteriaceae bacterium]
MSRLRTPFVGLVLAVLVLVFGSAASGEPGRQGAVRDTSLDSGASAHGTADSEPRTATAPSAGAPRQPAPQKPPRSRPGKVTKPQIRQRSQFRPSDKAADRSRTSQSRPSAQGSANGRTVYLTFDDGPSQYTPAILNILRATNSTATFFELGFRQAEHPGTAAQVRAEGSSVGNHTYDHPDLTSLKASEVRWQLTRGPQGRCMRPPYGATDPSVRRIVAQEGLREVLWSIDTLDWSRPGTTKIVKAATGPGVRAGSIVLMHDGGGDRSQTVAALPKIIRTLHHRGYVIRRIPGC